ncbi:MAG TPA: patatin-like phospholipase family protein [Acidimicrobiales bacterium]|nr:patatin-like phospholipase family protein [Acidimicrobiales bacterium]
MTWGLALGGGGVVALAWEVGVLRALEDAGLPRAATADVIVGTSAGSILATWLRRGRSTAELEADLGAGRLRLPGRARPLQSEDERRLYAEALRLWARPTAMTEEQAGQVGQVASRVVREDPERLASFEEEFGSDWPAGRLLVTTCRVSDGRRCAWDAQAGQPLYLAIAGSCTVPGQSPPLPLDGDHHIDGGVWSSTNADLLAGSGVTDVVALAPMAGAMGLGRAQGARLSAETDRLGAIGVEAVGLTPGDDFRKARMDLLDPKRAVEALAMGRAEGEKAAVRIQHLVGVKYSD